MFEFKKCRKLEVEYSEFVINVANFINDNLKLIKLYDHKFGKVFTNNYFTDLNAQYVSCERAFNDNINKIWVVVLVWKDNHHILEEDNELLLQTHVRFPFEWLNYTKEQLESEYNKLINKEQEDKALYEKLKDRFESDN